MEVSKSKQISERPPVIAIMGHVDHGKSTLLDTLRKSNIVEGEAGGITQHISAYELSQIDSEGKERRITFLDTPGHAAFVKMRDRGATIADIAVLIVSAEDSVKTQTIEAINIIQKNNVPFVVAINKIDKAGASSERVKTDLMEHGVYVEGYGGDVPCVAISAKRGDGLSDLLDTLLLLADISEFTGDESVPASGFIVESFLDPKRGIGATLVIKDGTISKGDYVVVDDAFSSTRLFEDFNSHALDTASFSNAVRVIGFNVMPHAGAVFKTYKDKKEAEKSCTTKSNAFRMPHFAVEEGQLLLPLILKADVVGSLEALDHEIQKIKIDDVVMKTVHAGVGAISESDIQLALIDEHSLILGFNIEIDNKARSVNDFDKVSLFTHNVIYKITEWLTEEAEKRRPRKEIREVIGSAKILAEFSAKKNEHTLGGRVEAGILKANDTIHIIHENVSIGIGKIISLQQGRSPAKSVEEGNEFGAIIESKHMIVKDDIIESIRTTTK